MAIKESQLRMKVQIYDGKFICAASVIAFLNMIKIICTEETDENGLAEFEFEDGKIIRVRRDDAIHLFCNYMTSNLEVFKAP